MPGLVGIIRKGPVDERRRELNRMLACMYKKERLESGTYVDDQRGVYVGWTCHKDSYSDCLPITDASSDTIIFFAGEHYAMDAEEEDRLANRHGCSRDKATMLLPLYRQKGDAFFACLNGFFHGLVIDHHQGQTILFNDRFGMQRLYYYEEPEALYFASEAKSLLAIRSEFRSFDPKGLGEWLSCGAVLEGRSLFKGIRVLPGGSRWTWGSGPSFTKRRYFSPESWERQSQMDTESFYKKLREVFVRRLPSYLRAEGKIGLSATAGLDTRMILANIKIENDALRCYTFCGPVRESFDVSIARQLSRVMDFEHITLKINDNLFRQFDRLAKDIILSTDGNLGMSGVPELFLNEKAHDLSPIRLTGNYGSEVLRHYRSFSSTDSICRVLDEDFVEYVRDAKETFAQAAQGHPLTYILFKQIPWFSYNRLQSEQAVLIMRSPFMENSLLEVVYQASDSSTKSMNIILRLIRDGKPKLADIKTDRGITYPKKADWVLTRAYHEFVFKMEYYASYGMPRFGAFLDKQLGPLSLERNFLGRHKYYHLRQWFRDTLAPFVKDILLDERTLSRSFLNRHNVIKAVCAHIAGTDNNTETIDKLLAMELTNRLLLDVDYE